MEERMEDARGTEESRAAAGNWANGEVIDVEIVPSFWNKCSYTFSKFKQLALRILNSCIIFSIRILVLPIYTFAWTTKKYRAWRYARTEDKKQISEREKCPGCGFRGCRLNFVRIATNEPDKKAMIEATCNRCSAKFYFITIKPLDKWWREPAPQQPQGSIRRVV